MWIEVALDIHARYSMGDRLKLVVIWKSFSLRGCYYQKCLGHLLLTSVEKLSPQQKPKYFETLVFILC
jgi:hypothetical protein